MSAGGVMAHSPDDISGFTALTGNDAVASVTLPFTFVVEGTGYTTLALSTNGWIEFGSNTSGNSDPTNDCLPTSAHTNPFFAAYWDDLAPFGTNVRYGTVGSSPNRVFIADYEVDLTSGSEGSDDLRFQIQLHEGSNLATVRFRDAQSGANGQQATLGYQGAGGAGATTVQALGCNGKILDDNRDEEGWSADVGRAGNVTLASIMQTSPDDISGFTTLTGDNNIATPTMPFSITLGGVSYNTVAISTNGWLEFGGNTAGDSDPTNDCLPTSAHTNPFLAAYWDDLNPWDTAIRYGTVGSSPNRVFVVDFKVDLTSGSEGSDDTQFQVQIHESSSLINVRYWDKQSGAIGQQATIGYQAAGGGSAAAYPLVCNARILDDNDATHEGWSVHPKSNGAMSIHAVNAFSPDDISLANIPALLTFSGDDVTQNATLPFTLTLDGVNYTTLTLSTNGWAEIGGNTSGNSDPTNDCLPTSAHTNPFIAAFWDDMQTAGSSTVQYGTVGSAPNRTFLANFFLDTKVSGNDGSDDVRMQLQIHEGSNAISVKYAPSEGLANGQTATMGYQSAGGASAAATAITCNGKVLDDNIPDSGWSVSPLPVCGDGVAESRGGEQCDAGGANGTAGSCCSSTCTFKANGTACTDDGNGCTNDQCNGASAICQHPNNSAPCSDGLFCNGADTCGGGSCSIHAGDPCPGADGDGDCAESCNEAGDACNLADPDGAACTDGLFCNGADTCSGGACTAHAGDPCPGADGDGNCSESCNEAGDACDLADADGSSCADGLFCNGTDTCSAGACTTHTGDPCTGPDGDLNCSESCDEGADNCAGADPDGTSCRPDAGECDVAETCSGGACPADGFESSGTACGDNTDTECDNPDTCDGAGSCGVNLETAGTACGDGTDDACTDADTCDGAGACEDNHEPPTTVCRAASVGQECDAVEFCDGAGGCPADGVLTAGTLCRGVAGVCDVQEDCDGVGSDCPADDFEPSSVVCRAAAGDCDVAEQCSGAAADCPSDAFVFAGTGCGDGSDSDCTNPDTCDGAGTCAANHELNGTGCTDDGETCTTDACDGAGACAHPAGNGGTTCRASAGGCDVSEQCDGSTPSCPADTLVANGTVCRADAGDCDIEEQCDGVSAACPGDVLESSGTACGDPSTTTCTAPDTCDGAGACQANHASAATVCRAASAGEACDAVELCDGAGACPADGVEPNTTVCRAAVDVCDTEETCDGVGSDCPADVLEPNTTVCRSDSGACDVAESCTGSSPSCPVDGFEADGTGCSDGQFCTGVDQCQSGVCVSPGSPCNMGETCNEATDGCFLGGCPTAPSSCQTAAKTLLLVKNDPTPSKNKLIWKWIKGAAATQTDFADPQTSADYAFCLYAGGSLLTAADVPANGTAWAPIGSVGFKYKDTTGAADGVQKLILKGTGTAGKSKALIKGKGANLPFGSLANPIVASPVVAQLRNNATGFCMQGTYSTPIKNTATQYKAKQ